MAAVFPFTFISVMVTAAFIAPAAFGRLGVLFTLAGLLTLVYGLGVVQGVIRYVYGVGGDEEVDDGDPETSGLPDRREMQRRLGAGLVFAILIAGTGTALMVLIGGWVVVALPGQEVSRTELHWALASAASGALHRQVLQPLRLERRVNQWFWVSVSRPALSVGLSALALSQGFGVAGVLGATAAGTALSVLLSLVLSRDLYRFGPRFSDFINIFVKARSVMPIIVAMWIVQNIDTIIVASIAKPRDVGLYRLASRYGAVTTYVTSALLMAWMPVQRTALFKTATEQRTRSVLVSTMFTYFCIACLAVLLIINLTADAFVAVAPASYAASTQYVTPAAAAFVSLGVVIALYRLSSLRWRRVKFVGVLLLSTCLSSFASLRLEPAFGIIVVPLSLLGGHLLAGAIMVALIRRSEKPVSFQWRRIGFFVLLAAAGYALGAVLGRFLPRVLIDAAVLVAVYLAVWRLRLLPRHRAADLRRLVYSVLPASLRAHRLARSDHGLSAEDVELMERAFGRNQPAEVIARDLDLSQPLVTARIARAVRRLAGLDTGPSGHDHTVGQLLVMRGFAPERSALANLLLERGVDAADLYTLEEVANILKRARRSSFRTMRRRPPRRVGRFTPRGA